LSGAADSHGSARARLRARLAWPEILVIPGAADALTARVIQEVGFEAVYATGAGFANASFALPDVGLITRSEVAEHVRRLTEAVDVPIVADADDGYGGPLSTFRTLAALESAGVAGAQFEDQAAPKRCGHFDGKKLVSADEMVEKLRAAIAARSDPNLVIVARTDAYESEGFDGVVRRARAYTAAGADAIFVEAIPTVRELAQLPGLIDAPLVANMVEGGKTPLVDASELERMGFRVVIYANTALRVAMQAVTEAMHVLKQTGGAETLLGTMLSWQERQRLVRLGEMEALEESFVVAQNHA
jgi:2,3-dimethylmalate lyase